MSEVKKGADQASDQEGVETQETAAPAELTSEDTASLVEALKGALDTADEFKKKFEKSEADKENYKKGMLKAKGKLKTEDSDEDETEEEKPAKNSSKPDVDVNQLLKRYSELVTTVVNKSQIGSAPAGAGSEAKTVVGDNLLSQDQVQDLKSRGWDDNKIARFKANLKNARA